MATLDKQVVKVMAEEIAHAIRKMNDENNRTYVNNQIANSKAAVAQTITGSISTSQVANLPAYIAALIGSAGDSENTDPNAQLIFSTMSVIADLRVENATITTAQIQDLYASYGEFIHLVADKAEIGELDVESIYADIADVGMANIGSADIGFAQIKDLMSDTAIIREGVGGKLYIDRLAVTDAQILSLTTGELIIQGEDGKLYNVYVDDEGKINTELRIIQGSDVGDGAISGSNIANGTITGSNIKENTITGALITESGITARELNVSQIFADKALIGAIKASNIDVSDLFANNAYINELTTAIIKSPTIGKDLDISQNSSITLTNERIALVVSSESTSSNLILTDLAIRAIADKISLTAATEITLQVGDSKFSITKDAFNSLIGNSENYTAIKQQANGIAAVTVDEDGNITAVSFTPEAIKAISPEITLSADQINAVASEINLTAEQINAVADDIDLSGNKTIVLTAEQINAVADKIDLSANDSVATIVGTKPNIYRSETAPTDANANDLWIQPSTGYTYQLASGEADMPTFYVDEDGILYCSFGEDQTKYEFYMDENGDLYVADGAPFSFSLSEDGKPVWWQRVRDSEWVGSIQNTEDDLEGKIANNYSEFQQTSEGFTASIKTLFDNEEELHTYITYENGLLNLGQSDSAYVAQVSNKGFEVLQDGTPMASMKQNTITAPVINAQRMFTIGDHMVRLGASGHLIFN